ncbi:MAG: pseudouridine-5'-phosphate glycosidase [Vulcanimicrobiaceae bacterium]
MSGVLELRLHDDVRSALAAGRAVVALETTILSHGMPYPQNLQTAGHVERIVREAGAIPATIAVLGGAIHVGLTEAQRTHIATAASILKLSRADLAYALATGRDGATTVAATMLCARWAGIEVFATGGIGGVHRDGHISMDISADVDELARTPVTVVCAGAKALLDIPRTLEALETRGVPVIGYGCEEFPAFWSRESGMPCPLRLDSPGAIAALIQTQRALSLQTGILIANPVDAADEIPRDHMEAAITVAIAESHEAGIRGKAVTPWLLDRIATLTAGRSLATNIALIQQNARLAAQIAVALTGR